MDATKSWIASYVDQHQGRVAYAEMIAAIPGELRRFVPSALRAMKQENTMRKQVRVVDGSPVFEVFRPVTE